MQSTDQERIQKTIARISPYSRREAETLIRQGEVFLNGKRAEIGDHVLLKDQFSIKVKGKLYSASQTRSRSYFVFNKPRGVISMNASDRSGRPTLKDYLGKSQGKLFPVGRLAYNDEGILILTNDGEFSEEVLSKIGKIERTYEIKVKGHFNEEQLERARHTSLPDTRKKADSIEVVKTLRSKSVIRIKFTTHHSIDVKTWAKNAGFLVERIARVGLGDLNLKGIPSGKMKIYKSERLRQEIFQEA